jgi:hypothetical protein
MHARNNVLFGTVRRLRAASALLWQARQVRTTRSKLLTWLACLCAGTSLVAGCAVSPGYSNPQPGAVRCDDTGTTAERHACR